MKETHTIKCFLKFGTEEHLLQLRDKGIIYMNPLEYFRNLEDEDLRGDNYEGVTGVYNLPPGEFEIPTLQFKGNHEGMHYCEQWENLNGNIFSLYCVSSHGFPDPREFKVDPKMTKFGTHVLLIKDNPKFLSLIKKELRRKKISFDDGFIEYYDRYAINGKVSVFQKPNEFAYQKEFRIYAWRNGAKPLVLELGSLAHMTELLPMELALEMSLEREAI